MMRVPKPALVRPPEPVILLLMASQSLVTSERTTSSRPLLLRVPPEMLEMRPEKVGWLLIWLLKGLPPPVPVRRMLLITLLPTDARVRFALEPKRTSVVGAEPAAMATVSVTLFTTLRLPPVVKPLVALPR